MFYYKTYIYNLNLSSNIQYLYEKEIIFIPMTMVKDKEHLKASHESGAELIINYLDKLYSTDYINNKVLILNNYPERKEVIIFLKFHMHIYKVF